jgi:hypothetical protein
VNTLTSGDFGPVTITNPITINGNGNDASIDFAGDGEGVYVDMSTPGTARLEGLDINGEGTGDDAVFDDSVTVDNTSFYNNETDYEADTQNWNATFDDDVMTGTTTPVFTLYTIGGVTSNLEVDNSQITANDGAVFGDDGGV